MKVETKFNIDDRVRYYIDDAYFESEIADIVIPYKGANTHYSMGILWRYSNPYMAQLYSDNQSRDVKYSEDVLRGRNEY